MIDLENLDETNQAQDEVSTTKRATVEALEPFLYNPIKVLDHGFVRLIDYMGDDSAVVQAARVSYGKGTKTVRQDKGLIFYLMRHRHTTPFEMCEIKFHVKLPIFVARQWIRHRTANVNEYSARYSVLGNEFYLPAREQLAAQSHSNRQGRDRVLSEAEAAKVMDMLERDATMCYQHYQEMLNENEHGEVLDEGRQGLTRELARMNLTLNYYTEWYWKVDLHNLLNFVKLRADPHAQYEIRVYAEAMLDIIKHWVPLTYEAFEEYSLGGANFSASAIKAINRMIQGEKVTQADSGLSQREWQEMMHALKLEA